MIVIDSNLLKLNRLNNVIGIDPTCLNYPAGLIKQTDRDSQLTNFEFNQIKPQVIIFNGRNKGRRETEGKFFDFRRRKLFDLAVAKVERGIRVVFSQEGYQLSLGD